MAVSWYTNDFYVLETVGGSAQGSDKELRMSNGRMKPLPNMEQDSTTHSKVVSASLLTEGDDISACCSDHQRKLPDR